MICSTHSEQVLHVMHNTLRQGEQLNDWVTEPRVESVACYNCEYLMCWMYICIPRWFITRLRLVLVILSFRNYSFCYYQWPSNIFCENNNNKNRRNNWRNERWETRDFIFTYRNVVQVSSRSEPHRYYSDSNSRKLIARL